MAESGLIFSDFILPHLRVHTVYHCLSISGKKNQNKTGDMRAIFKKEIVVAEESKSTSGFGKTWPLCSILQLS